MLAAPPASLAIAALKSLPAGFVRAGDLGCADQAEDWECDGLKPWIEVANKRLHHNVLAIALANKLARIAWREHHLRTRNIRDSYPVFRGQNRIARTIAHTIPQPIHVMFG